MNKSVLPEVSRKEYIEDRANKRESSRKELVSALFSIPSLFGGFLKAIYVETFSQIGETSKEKIDHLKLERMAMLAQEPSPVKQMRPGHSASFLAGDVAVFVEDSWVEVRQ